MQVFIDNLVYASAGEATILDTGRIRGIGRQFLDWIQRKHGQDYTIAILHKLSHALDGHDQALNIPVSQRIQIAARLHLDFNKMTAEAQNEAYALFKRVESWAFEGEDKHVIQASAYLFVTHRLALNDQAEPNGIHFGQHRLHICACHLHHAAIELLMSHFANNSQALQALDVAWKHTVLNINSPTQQLANGFFWGRSHDRKLLRTFLEIESVLLKNEPKSKELALSFLQNIRLMGERLIDYKKQLAKNSSLPTGYPPFIEMRNYWIVLGRVLEENSDDHIFISSALSEINNFLQKILSYSNGPYPLGQSHKNWLEDLTGELFPIINNVIPKLPAKEDILAMQLRLTLANLPCPNHRAYPNIFLNNCELLHKLMTDATQQENQMVSQLIEGIRKGRLPLKKQRLFLARLIRDHSHLSPHNRIRLRNALQTAFKLPTNWNWNDPNLLYPKLKGRSHEAIDVNALMRIARTRSFYKKQSGLPEQQIHIPQWYHATQEKHFKSILSTGKIDAKRIKCWSGIWMSSRHEKYYGNFVFAFSPTIANLDDKPAHQTAIQDDVRWRAIYSGQRLSLSLLAENPNVLASLAIPSQSDKRAQKDVKSSMRTLMVESTVGMRRISQTVDILSTNQLEFMHEHFVKCLGAPNLSSSWWG